MKNHPAMWTTLQIALLVSPFWFLASNLNDLDEVYKTALGGALVAAAAGIKKLMGV